MVTIEANDKTKQKIEDNVLFWWNDLFNKGHTVQSNCYSITIIQNPFVLCTKAHLQTNLQTSNIKRDEITNNFVR